MAVTPYLTTQRFDLWQPQAGDLDHLVALVSGEETRRFLGPQRADRSSQFERLLKAAGSWALYGYGSLYVRERGAPADSPILGSLGLFHSFRGFVEAQGMDDVPEAGWVVRPDWWRKGVAGEGMAAVLTRFDAERPGVRVACMIEQGNVASLALAARLGFRAYGEQIAPDDGAVLALLERMHGRRT